MGDDAGRKITGRNRHMLTHTDGRQLCARVHSAEIQNRDGGKLPL